jgi:hypothetical protein
MIPYWPTNVPDCPERYRATGGPVDARAAFQPERGPEITRAATTARWEEWTVPMSPFTLAQFNAFEAWFDASLARGSKAFAWRHPVTGVIGLWRFKSAPRPYDVSQTAKGYVLVSFTALRQPGTPWWSPYVRAGENRVPYAVADYAGSVFGVAGLRTAASAVAAVAGTYDVYTTATPSGTVTEELAHVVIAGDIPASAPVGVSKIVAYLP